MHTIQDMPPHTRVWVYTATTPFRQEDIPEVRRHLAEFAKAWVSHNRQLTAHADLLHERFVVLMVDESGAGASGCSIDASVNFLKSLQHAYHVDLFDRMYFSYLTDDGRVETVPREEFAQRYAEGLLHEGTPVFDTLVATKAALDGWVKPLGESWHRRMV